jgi:hypothetical protein
MTHHFDFINFTPEKTLAARADLVLEDVLEDAPADGAVVARLVHHSVGFEATIEIFSRAGYFVARAFEPSPELAIESVKQRIETKLNLWKESRSFEALMPNDLEEGFSIVVPPKLRSEPSTKRSSA